MDFIIRPARPDDISGMCGLLNELFSIEADFEPDPRKQAIGSLLLEHVADWAQEQKLKRLQLLADTKNFPALAFYSWLGWKKTGLICLRKML